ncbi:hypothetical protein V2J09_015988 [Rumex salicifolius]
MEKRSQGNFSPGVGGSPSLAPGIGVSEATMMEGVVGENPSGDPPDRGGGTWADKVSGGGVGGMPVPEKVLNDDFVMAKTEIKFPNGADGEPEIVIGQEVLDVMTGLWKNCMYIKVLDRSMPLPLMDRKLREVWKPNGGMSVVDLPRRFFLIRFDLEGDYLDALTGGPWKVFGNHILIQAWDPFFDPLTDDITSTPVWVRFSNIPMIYYHRTILMRIAEGIGKPLKVDMATLKFERGRFARICIEVDLRKPLKGSLTINGTRYFVSYEGLNTICSNCGIYGHLAINCSRKRVDTTGVIETHVEANEEMVEVSTPQVVIVNEVPESTREPKKMVDASHGDARVRVTPANPSSSSPMVADLPGGDTQIREISAAIPTQNQFARLAEDCEEIIMAAEQITAVDSDLDTKNEQVNLSVSKLKGKEKSKVGPGEVGAVFASSGNRVSKLKFKKENRPSRGLVFGPTGSSGEDVNLGKRQRRESFGVLGNGVNRLNVQSLKTISVNVGQVEASRVDGSREA